MTQDSRRADMEQIARIPTGQSGLPGLLVVGAVRARSLFVACPRARLRHASGAVLRFECGLDLKPQPEPAWGVEQKHPESLMILACFWGSFRLRCEETVSRLPPN